MEQNAWNMLLLGIAVSSGLFALGVVPYPKLRTEKQGCSFEVEIESALLPIILNGIFSAYCISKQSVERIHQRIRDADKRKIANNIYAMLPDKLASLKLFRSSILSARNGSSG